MAGENHVMERLPFRTVGADRYAEPRAPDRTNRRCGADHTARAADGTEFKQRVIVEESERFSLSMCIISCLKEGRIGSGETFLRW